MNSLDKILKSVHTRGKNEEVDDLLSSISDASIVGAELNEGQADWLLTLLLGTATSPIRYGSPEFREFVTTTATWINSCQKK